MRGRLWILFIAHLILGVSCSAWAGLGGRIPFVPEGIVLVPPFALVFCQSGLLAFWAVMARIPLWIRISGWILGSIFLELLLVWTIRESVFVPMSVFATAIVTVVLAVVHIRKVRLHQNSELPKQGNLEGLRFSVRGLMIFTLSIAVMMAAARGLRVIGAGDSIWLILGSFVVCFVVMNLVSIWAMLGPGSPTSRSAAVMIMALVQGLVWSWAMRGEWEVHFYVISLMFLHTALLLGSFFVLRSCGYRLVKAPAV